MKLKRLITAFLNLFLWITVCKAFSLFSKQIIRLITETLNDKDVKAVAWRPDGKLLAIAGELPDPVVIWDPATPSIRQPLDQGSRGWGDDNITFSPVRVFLFNR